MFVGIRVKEWKVTVVIMAGEVLSTIFSGVDREKRSNLGGLMKDEATRFRYSLDV